MIKFHCRFSRKPNIAGRMTMGMVSGRAISEGLATGTVLREALFGLSGNNSYSTLPLYRVVSCDIEKHLVRIKEQVIYHIITLDRCQLLLGRENC